MKLWVRVAIITIILISGYFLYTVNSSVDHVDDIDSYAENNNRSYKIFNTDNDTTLIPIDKAIQNIFRREGLRGGAVVAISRNGRLVYAKGYGHKDLSDSTIMQPYNIMRIASCSKLITAIAVMKLVEEGKITLHQRVFGPVGILNNDEYLVYRDKRMDNVTVYQLLNHSAGWTSRWGDPMFMPHAIARQMGKELPISMSDIIRFMQEKRMHFTPGTASVYSNFGYGILGEVVAKASGMPYERYVKSLILAPMGIYDTQIGFSHREHRLPDEVAYYESDTSSVAFDYTDGGLMVRRAYGGTDIQTLGSAGGWVASATDLLKLALTVDGFDNVPDIIPAELVDTMVHNIQGFDPLGWRSVVGNSWYRSGTLAATSAMIARHPDGICYVVLLNCSNHRGPALANNIRNVFDAAIKQVEMWPDVDLWSDDHQWNVYKSQAANCNK